MKWPFKVNLTTLLGQARGGHLYFPADALSEFQYVRYELGALVSVSLDGTSLPEIYILNVSFFPQRVLKKSVDQSFSSSLDLASPQWRRRARG